MRASIRVCTARPADKEIFDKWVKQTEEMGFTVEVDNSYHKEQNPDCNIPLVSVISAQGD